MQHILVYGDSLTWGIVPNTRKRFRFEERWPGILENGLNERGRRVRITEDCLNGRRTVWEDPFKAGRNGLTGLAQCMEKHSPLALVILMLGTNDFQFSHPYNNAWSAAQGVAALVKEIRTAPIEPGVPVPPVLVICPPLITSPKGILAPKFLDAEKKCLGLAVAYAVVCQELNCTMFDAGSVTASSRVDGIHLDSDQHRTLGQALVGAVAPMLEKDPV